MSAQHDWSWLWRHRDEMKLLAIYDDPAAQHFLDLLVEESLVEQLLTHAQQFERDTYPLLLKLEIRQYTMIATSRTGREPSAQELRSIIPMIKAKVFFDLFGANVLHHSDQYAGRKSAHTLQPKPRYSPGSVDELPDPLKGQDDEDPEKTPVSRNRG